MPLRNHKAVMAGVEMLEGRAVKRMGRAYRELVTGPIVETLKSANSFDDLTHRLQTGATLARMDERVVGGALAETGVQAALIGRAAATPRNVETSKSRKVETKV